MFERFTDRARHVIVLAQEEARLLNHAYIGTEHLLLGLVHEGEGVAAQALRALDISLSAVRTEVEGIIGRGEGVPSGHIPFTPRAKKVLELSLREALHLDHNYIGTEHILLGLIREQEGVAAQVLVKLGARQERVREKVVELLGAAKPGEPGEPETTPGGRMPASRRVVADIGSSLSGRLDEVLTRLERLEHRLTGIERVLGHAPGRSKEPSTLAPDAGAQEPPAAGRPGEEPPQEPPAAGAGS